MSLDFTTKCFVCEEPVANDCLRNSEINLPVCDKCRNTDEEIQAVKKLQEGMADGFVCGCI
ncbi:hypothetical protein [Mangrovibacterium sp.]|uniref:hypothetical protein n=1 Tax=Mangrovibacterium sp. TaxID=1961364 RepID=UPI0035661646